MKWPTESAISHRAHCEMRATQLEAELDIAFRASAKGQKILFTKCKTPNHARVSTSLSMRYFRRPDASPFSLRSVQSARAPRTSASRPACQVIPCLCLLPLSFVSPLENIPACNRHSCSNTSVPSGREKNISAPVYQFMPTIPRSPGSISPGKRAVLGNHCPGEEVRYGLDCVIS
jgi:hypothetical protein